jgi:hypothetical protein
LPSLPGCPDILARQALLDSAIEFCESSGIVRITPDPQSVQAGVTEYDVEVPTGQKVCSVLKAWYGTKELDPAPHTMMSNVQAYVGSVGGVAPSSSDPLFFFELSPGVVAIYPAPSISAAAMLTFRISTKPSRVATQVDDILLEDWVEGIVYGAKARLHAIPDTNFFSDTHSDFSRSAFRLAVNLARTEALRGRIRGSLNIRARALA